MGPMERTHTPLKMRKLSRRLARPWVALALGASTLIGGQLLWGRLHGLAGGKFDLLLDLSLVTFLSIGLIWAPMWSMRTSRNLWRGLSHAERRQVARQILVQGLCGAPLIWVAVTFMTAEVRGGWLLSGSVLGCVFISLGAATTLWFRTLR